MMTKLYTDETGFIISAELVLISTIVVLGMIVGLSEIQHAIVTELNDVADAFGNLNQSYYYTGFSKRKQFGRGVAAFTRGSAFGDAQDDCDNNQCAITCDAAVGEGPKWGGRYGNRGGSYGGGRGPGSHVEGHGHDGGHGHHGDHHGPRGDGEHRGHHGE